MLFRSRALYLRRHEQRLERRQKTASYSVGTSGMALAAHRARDRSAPRDGQCLPESSGHWGAAANSCAAIWNLLPNSPCAKSILSFVNSCTIAISSTQKTRSQPHECDGVESCSPPITVGRYDSGTQNPPSPSPSRTHATAEDLLEIVMRRYEHASTLLTSEPLSRGLGQTTRRQRRRHRHA